MTTIEVLDDVTELKVVINNADIRNMRHNTSKTIRN